jgi:hypothetical protein
VKWFSFGATDYQRLEIFMDFQVLSRFGVVRGDGEGAVRWHTIRSHVTLPEERARISLATLLYGRILVAHAETRAELFSRVEQAARGLLDGDEVARFEEWELHVGEGDFELWPWRLVDREVLNKPKAYVSTLKGDAHGVLWVDLKMAWGLERVLAPSSVLLALHSLSGALGESDRRLFGRGLLAMNERFGSPDGAKGLGAETKAFADVLPMLATRETEGD